MWIPFNADPFVVLVEGQYYFSSYQQDQCNAAAQTARDHGKVDIQFVTLDQLRPD